MFKARICQNMSKLGLNLTKITKKSVKISGRKVFFVGHNIGLVRRTGKEKRMDSCNIHLRFKDRQIDRKIDGLIDGEMDGQMK